MITKLSPLIPSFKHQDNIKIKSGIQELIDKALECTPLKELSEKGCLLGDPLHG